MIAYLGTLKPLSVTPTPVAPYNLDYLVIAGGGAGGGSNHVDYFPLGTGGAGGYISGLFASVTDSAYYIFVGAGGVSNNSSGKGNDSYLQSFSNKITSIGGGGPGYNSVFASTSISAQNGGSGYGAIGTGGAGILGQGFPGGSGPGGSLDQAMGGGGGAGQAGANYLTAKGGDGLTWLDGITRAGGGGGFTDLFVEGAGGAGGGGNGGVSPNVGQPGGVNTGSGGGGSSRRNGGVSGGAGGSGIVKVRYAGTPRATGGTITQSGGFTYHEFTSSGRLIFTS